MGLSKPLSSDAPTTVDEKATVALTMELMQAVRAHYARRPQGRVAVFEALVAIAALAAEVIAGTSGGGRQYFDRALDAGLEGR